MKENLKTWSVCGPQELDLGFTGLDVCGATKEVILTNQPIPFDRRSPLLLHNFALKACSVINYRIIVSALVLMMSGTSLTAEGFGIVGSGKCMFISTLDLKEQLTLYYRSSPTLGEDFICLKISFKE